MVQFFNHVKFLSLSRAMPRPRQLVLVCVLVGLCLGLGACGKKPSFVDPPQDEPATTFPRHYPDITTDPQS